MAKGKVRDTQGIDVRREGREDERLGVAIENGDGTWTAFTAHPMKDHPLLGTRYGSSREAYLAIMAYEIEGDAEAARVRNEVDR